MTDESPLTPEVASDPAVYASYPGAERGRLWTPWRMPYVGGGAREPGCLFCNRLADRDDVRSLILHRAPAAFVIMNLFPYNTGHVMVVPNAHVASPEDADAASVTGMANLVPPTLRALRRVLTCDGFNVGLNVGAEAGAGVAAHLHQHVVPRWLGDANFMPVLASTTVMPEVIPVTYAKARAELGREMDGSAAIAVLLLDGARRALVDTDGMLPLATAAPDEPLWKAAVRAAAGWTGRRVELVGWAGDRSVREPRRTLWLRVVDPDPNPPPSPLCWSPLAEAGADVQMAAVAAGAMPASA